MAAAFLQNTYSHSSLLPIALHLASFSYLHDLPASLGIWTCACSFGHTHWWLRLLSAHHQREERASSLLSAHVPPQRAGPQHSVGQNVTFPETLGTPVFILCSSFVSLIREDPRRGTHRQMIWVIPWWYKMRDTNISFALFVLLSFITFAASVVTTVIIFRRIDSRAWE